MSEKTIKQNSVLGNTKRRERFMAKIDVSTIENYENMSVEEKLKALTEYEFTVPEDNTSEMDKLKTALSKANAEAASWKKQLRSKQTADEAAEAERLASEKEKDDLIKTLQRDKAVSTNKSAYLAMGYDEELATKSAEALVDGDLNKVFEYQKSFNDGYKKSIESSVLDKQPDLSNGKPLTQKAIEEEERKKMRQYFGL